VYRKLGFERVSDYVFFERKAASQPASNHPRIRRFGSADEQAVLALDHLATCEVRALFLHRFLDDAWVHVSSSGGVDGCHLPRLGNGLVIADNDIAGLALLQHKLSLGTQSIVVPDGNRAAVDCLLAEGFRETSRAPRMALGGDVDWQPRMVYSRGSGYCG
jgi:hypothetical protein